MISIKVWHYIDISADFDPGKPVSTRKLAAEYGAETDGGFKSGGSSNPSVKTSRNVILLNRRIRIRKPT